ncbi:MAG: efflux RND transporter periplasmic adaptor subunit [Chitinophagaceae bacterium]|nr:efflux RND transporter periplasmic adaptor subunit [Chitinophagaceae bacterium]
MQLHSDSTKINLLTGKKNKNHLFRSIKSDCVYLFAVGIFLVSCGGGKNKSAMGMQGMMGPATVSVFDVSPSSYTITESFPATLAANTIVQIRPDVTGYLEAIRVADGSHVTRGQVLYEIDKSRYVAAYNQAKASLQQAIADQGQKQRDLDRYKDLLKHDAIAVQVADQAGTALKTSEANVAAAKAAVAKAATDLDHSMVRASINGRIGIVQAKVGDIINAGQTLLNTVVNDDPMYVDFNLLQSRIGDFTGKALAGKQFFLKLSDSTTYPFPGKLLVINNVVDPTTGNIVVRLEFPNKNGMLKSGMSASVIVRYSSGENSLAIPTKSLVQILSENSVFVVDKNNVIKSIRVTPGSQLDSMTVIQSGLNPGDRVVVDGLQKIHQGDTVKIIGSH